MAKLPMPAFSLSGTSTAMLKVPVSPGGEEVKPNGLGGFCAVGAFVPLSMQVDVAPEPHHP
jgi:hypothetical protein